MRAFERGSHSADVVAVFENQWDADEAVLQLRVAGFRENQIGCYTWPRTEHTDMLDHDREFSGAILGGVVGAALGLGVAYLVAEWLAARTGVRDPFGVFITCAFFGAMFFGFAGWWIGSGIHKREVEMPAVDETVGPIVLAVEAGDDAKRDRAWALIREHGGHELPPGAMVPHPGAA